jgi:hypothetical protein
MAGIYEVRRWGAMIYIPSFIKIGSPIQKLTGERTDTQHGDRKSLLLFFQNKEGRLKISREMILYRTQVISYGNSWTHVTYISLWYRISDRHITSLLLARYCIHFASMSKREEGSANALCVTSTPLIHLQSLLFRHINLTGISNNS